ncbi:MULTISPECIES: SDR family NAD(P)-dependent oxidoreductase [unclassified Frankia]|uniref:SDR family NAD(P)-dependent oxidoreductase n=1 Tax=unclassified Frankia TaxID=2632575 RepID=UPI004044787B
MARTVLVTGAGGFIGGHLAAALVRGGSHVRAFLRYNSRGERGSLEWHDQHVVRDMEIVFGDLRDVEPVARAAAGVEVVFHLGAQIAIPYSYVNARDFFETNVLGTLNVAEAALRAGVRRVVHTSTSEVYGTARTIPMTENHPLAAQSPYAASKTGGDQLMEAFHRSHQLPVTVLRPFNTYGPHQSARAVTTTVITQALAGGTLRLGELDTRRDLTFVSDTVAGFLAAAESDAAVGRTVHLGTGHDVSVAELVTAVGDLLGRKLAVDVDRARLRPPHSEVARLVSNPALARELLGWAPSVDLDTGLTTTIGWIKSNMGRFRVGEYAR